MLRVTGKGLDICGCLALFAFGPRDRASGDNRVESGCYLLRARAHTDGWPEWGSGARRLTIRVRADTGDRLAQGVGDGRTISLDNCVLCPSEYHRVVRAPLPGELTGWDSLDDCAPAGSQAILFGNISNQITPLE